MVERRRISTVIPTYGRGFARMKARLGPEQSEALRQTVLREQVEALADAGKHRQQELRDRDTYKDYPPPKEKGKRKKK